MEIPQELRDIESELDISYSRIIQVRHKLERFRAGNTHFDKFSDLFYKIDTQIRQSHDNLDETRRLFKELFTTVGQESLYPKNFDLYPGDRIRITAPAQEPFPAGWAEGTVIDAHWWSDAGWYIEFEKESVSPGWQTGYGYWKQREDGGMVEKL